MSLILDALKKLDRERNAENPGGRDIAAELLRAADSPGRSGLFALAIALGVAASLAALVTFLALGGTGEKTAAVPAKPSAPAAKASQAAAVSLPPAPAAVPDRLAPPQAASQATRPDAVAVQPDRAGEPAAKQRSAPGKRDLAVRAPSRTEAAPSRPAVKISAIVWQEEPSERKAMINGRTARQGDLVDGMKVLEIHPSHVRVSFEGKVFTVGMFD